MAKLYFRHGTMNSSKTANLLMIAYNYRSQGKKVVLMKPSTDNRFGSQNIKSRAVQGMEANIIILPCRRVFDLPNDVECVLVDEAQFLTPVNVEGLRNLSQHVPVICYGLRTDYKSYLFPGSKRLLEIADNIEEIKTICVNCNTKAIINAKFFYDRVYSISEDIEEQTYRDDLIDSDVITVKDGKETRVYNVCENINKRKKIIVRNGPDNVDLGSEEKYQPMCWNCWKDECKDECKDE